LLLEEEAVDVLEGIVVVIEGIADEIVSSALLFS